MRDLERDLKIAELITAELKPYLLSEGVYWELSQRGPLRQPFPKGTLAGLLFRLHLLDAMTRGLSPEQWERYRTLRDQAAELLQHWRVQAEQKAVKEFASRLRTWSAFVDDASDYPTEYRTEYPSQVENRVGLEFLLQFAGQQIGEAARAGLASADRQLDSLTAEGDFVWDAELQDAYPAERFPWLYVQLRDLRARL